MAKPPPYDADAQEALMSGQVLTGQHRLAQFEPEALAAALLQAPDGDAARLLRALAIDPAAARLAAERALERMPSLSAGSDVSIASTRLRNVLALAEAEAVRAGDGTVGAGHLLLAVLAAGDSAVARDLAHGGATADGVRRVLAAERGVTRPAEDAGAPAAIAADADPAARPLDADLAAEVDALLGDLLRTTRAAVAVLSADLESGGAAASDPARKQAAAAWLDRAPALLEQTAGLRAAPRRSG